MRARYVVTRHTVSRVAANACFCCLVRCGRAGRCSVLKYDIELTGAAVAGAAAKTCCPTQRVSNKFLMEKVQLRGQLHCVACPVGLGGCCRDLVHSRCRPVKISDDLMMWLLRSIPNTKPCNSHARRRVTVALPAVSQGISRPSTTETAHNTRAVDYSRQTRGGARATR